MAVYTSGYSSVDVACVLGWWVLYTVYYIYYIQMHGKYIKIAELLFYTSISINSCWNTSAISSVLTRISVF